MKKNISIIFLIFCAIANAQIDALDVLKGKLKTAPVEAIMYADSLLLPQTKMEKKYFNKIKYYKGIAYQGHKNHLKALEIFDSLEGSFEPTDILFVKTLLFQSHSNSSLKNYTLATDQALKALDAAMSNGYFNLVASAYSSLSYIEYSNKKYTKSYEYLLTSIGVQEKEKDSVLMASTYNNLAIIYRRTGMFKEALNASKKSLELDKLLGRNINIGSSYCNIADAYLLLNDKEKAKEYFLKAIAHNKKEKISNSIPDQNIGDFYYKTNKYQKSEEHYLKALYIEIEKENPHRISNMYDQLLEVAIQLKDYKKVFLYKTKFDSIRSVNAISEGEEKLNMLEKQHKLFWNEKELHQIKTINTKNKIIFIVVLLVFLLVAIALFFKIKNNTLYLAKEKLILEQTVLRSQMNPHFIFNALAAIQNSLLDNDPLKSATYISRFSKLIRQNFDFIDKKVIPLADEIDALKNYMDTQQLRFEGRFEYEIAVGENIDIDLVTIPPLLIQPFIENAIEHGFKNKKEKGSIQLKVSKEAGRIIYEIKDNGTYKSSLKNDGKLHAIDIFKKRLKLREYKEEQSFSIVATSEGTLVKFSLKS
ncbi:MAG: hypothetical protein COB81_08830 [Flavobacteriaceae bacterium]|nr:MAG: hypothetical protein COB81_08830 [Flavobacteriaceae bacterium]